MRILLVDDAELVLLRTKRILEDLPFVSEVFIETNSKKAVEAIISLQPQIVFLDINMPQPNGLEILKAMHQYPNAPLFAMLTNETMEAYRDACQKMGAKYFIDKATCFESIPNLLKEIGGH
jgi:CheY-like chemotaxis protein